MNEDPVTNCGI